MVIVLVAAAYMWNNFAGGGGFGDSEVGDDYDVDDPFYIEGKVMEVPPPPPPSLLSPVESRGGTGACGGGAGDGEGRSGRSHRQEQREREAGQQGREEAAVAAAAASSGPNRAASVAFAGRPSIMASIRRLPLAAPCHNRCSPTATSKG